MNYKTVLYKKDEQVAYITLNRPEKLNTITTELFHDWQAAMTEAEEDDDVKVVVFRGAGRCFSAGAPLDQSWLCLWHERAESLARKVGRIPQRVRLNFRQKSFPGILQKGVALQENNNCPAA